MEAAPLLATGAGASGLGAPGLGAGVRRPPPSRSRGPCRPPARASESLRSGVASAKTQGLAAAVLAPLCLLAGRAGRREQRAPRAVALRSQRSWGSPERPLRVVIVGAGPGGLALACSLSRVPGLDVRILEARSLSQSSKGSSRSHSIGLGRRAREALIAVGGQELWDRVKQNGFVASGFNLHLNGFALELPPPEGEPVVLVDRWKICEALADHVASTERAPGTTITVESGVRVDSVDLVGRRLSLDRGQSVNTSQLPALQSLPLGSEGSQGTDTMSWDLLVGASGVRSAVRQAMGSQLPDSSFESQVKMKPGRWQVLHMDLPSSFARGSVHALVNSEAPFGLFCIPNITGEHCVIVSWSDEQAPQELLEAGNPQELQQVILKYFPQVGCVPDEAARNFLQQRASQAVLSRCRPLHHAEAAVCVLGDAAHAVGGGSLGQGCSAALQDAAALGGCLLRAVDDEGEETPAHDADSVLACALAAYSEQRAQEGWALLDLIELQAANELRADALLQGPVVMGFLIEQLGRGTLKPLAELGAQVLGTRLQRNQSSLGRELETVPLLGLLHEQMVLDTWKRFFDRLASIRPDMQTALMATDEPYSELVDRNTPWISLLQLSKASFGAQQMQVARDITALRSLPDALLLDWAAAFSPCQRLKGDVIVRQSTVVKNFFAVRTGSCSVFRNGQEVARLGPGDHYGGIALLLGVPSSTSLVASTDAQLLEMPGDAFLQLVEQASPELRTALSAPAERFRLGLDSVASDQDAGRSRVRALLQQRAHLAPELEESLSESACEMYVEGEVITMDARESLRILESGLAAVVRRGTEVRMLKPGDFFGPDLQPGEQVVARGDYAHVCRFASADASANYS